MLEIVLTPVFCIRLYHQHPPNTNSTRICGIYCIYVLIFLIKKLKIALPSNSNTIANPQKQF